MAATIDRNAYTFFREHAGACVGHNAEGAASLARAETFARVHGWTYRWEDDQLPWDSDIDDYKPQYVLGCTLIDEAGEDCEAVWGIADPDRNYERVIEAELASEHLARYPIMARVCIACGSPAA